MSHCDQDECSSQSNIELGSSSGTLSLSGDTVTYGSSCCGQSEPEINLEKRNIEDNYAEYKYLLPNLTKDQVDVKVKNGRGNNPAIVKVRVNREDVEDNEFVNRFERTLQFDSLYDIDTLIVDFSDSVLTIRVNKHEDELYRHVDMG